MKTMQELKAKYLCDTKKQEANKDIFDTMSSDEFWSFARMWDLTLKEAFDFRNGRLREEVKNDR